jgi:hypothetical protein
MKSRGSDTERGAATVSEERRSGLVHEIHEKKARLPAKITKEHEGKAGELAANELNEWKRIRNCTRYERVVAAVNQITG